MGLQPKTVTVITGPSSEKVVPIEQIRPGDIILVKPGERIAVDGIVTEGSSYVDESMLSGEPVAVAKQKNAKVFAGTINQKGSFRFSAEKVGTDTLLAKIIHMVQDAQGSTTHTLQACPIAPSANHHVENPADMPAALAYLARLQLHPVSRHRPPP